MVSLMTGNQVVSAMFDYNTCNTWLDSYFWVTRLKTLDIISWTRLRWSMYNLWHIDPLCMFRGYVVLIWNFSHRSTVYSGGYAIFWRHGSTVYDWWPWPMSTMSSICDLSMGIPTSELVYMIFCRCLVVRRFSIRCAPGFRHTHVAYKVFWLSLIPASYFGGHSVTHDFGQSWWCIDDGVLRLLIRTFSWEKWHSSLPRKLTFEESSQVANILGCENDPFSHATFS